MFRAIAEMRLSYVIYCCGAVSYFRNIVLILQLIIKRLIWNILKI